MPGTPRGWLASLTPFVLGNPLSHFAIYVIVFSDFYQQLLLLSKSASVRTWPEL